MLDMASTVVPKSTQLNADDLISGPRTINITRVTGTGNAEQPVAVYFDGDDGRPFLPCKTVRRIMIAAWGVDAATYVGRSMTLYRDPDVMFGGMKIGGLRVSHMSHISAPLNLLLTVSKAKRTPYRVQPLAQDNAGVPPPADSPAHAVNPSNERRDPSAQTARAGHTPSNPWLAGSETQTKTHRIPLVSPASAMTRYFETVPAWCDAIDLLLTDEFDSPADVWDQNNVTHVKLMQAAKTDAAQTRLKAVADAAFKAIKAAAVVEGHGA